jgi:hypothetical protein
MRASIVCAGIALAAVGCGGAAVGGPEWTVAHARPAEPEAPPLALGAMVIAEPSSSEPLLVLDEDGTAHHANCPLTVRDDGTVLGDDGAVVVRLDGDVIARGGEDGVLFRLEGERLIRADGRAARVERGQIVFEESAELTLRVEGAETEAQRRTVLVLVAALSICGE